MLTNIIKQKIALEVEIYIFEIYKLINDANTMQ